MKGRQVEKRKTEQRAGPGSIPADGRDVTPVGRKTDHKEINREGGAEMEEEERGMGK